MDEGCIAILWAPHVLELGDGLLARYKTGGVCACPSVVCLKRCVHVVASIRGDTPVPAGMAACALAPSSSCSSTRSQCVPTRRGSSLARGVPERQEEEGQEPLCARVGVRDPAHATHPSAGSSATSSRSTTDETFRFGGGRC
eukprot:4905836-Pyramimonas_sp.AAC.1